MVKLNEINDPDLKAFLTVANAKILNNTTLVTPETLGKSTLHHIAYRKMYKLVPNISKRANQFEDNTFIRVHTAPTLIGCITGFGDLFIDILFSQNKKYTTLINNTIYLYTIPFQYGLKPNDKLVPDAKETDETWLFPYSKDTRLITPSFIEELVVLNVRVKPEHDKHYEMQATFRLSVSKGNEVELDKGIVLGEGDWNIVIKKNFNNTHALVDYHKSKINKAYLSLEDKYKPVWANWGYTE